MAEAPSYALRQAKLHATFATSQENRGLFYYILPTNRLTVWHTKVAEGYRYFHARGTPKVDYEKFDDEVTDRMRDAQYCCTTTYGEKGPSVEY